jgi:type IV pilus assembly protein PilX
MLSRPAPRRPAQRGFILVTGMLFLVVMTLIALAMFRSTGMMDRISANARDKQRAFEAAQTTLQYGEWWLSTHTPGAPAACNGLVDVTTTVSNIHVCSNALQSDFLTATQWTNAFTYTPPNLNVSTTGGMTGLDTNYNKVPGFYIEYLGLSSLNAAPTYQITAYGFGGDGNTVSIVRSTYQLAGTGPGSGTGGNGGGGLGGP